MFLLGNKQVAKCLLCLKVLSNTSMSRLVMHRKVCKCNTNRCRNESISNHDNPDPVVIETSISSSNYTFANHHQSAITSVSSSMSNDQESSFQNKRKRSNSININSDSDNDEVSGGSKSIINASCIVSPLSDINKSTKSTASYLGTQSDVDFTSVALCPQPDSITTVKKNANKQNNMYKYHDKITSIEIDSVNYKLGKLFFGCNIPFSIVESEHFKGFCQAWRPAYKPPSRKVY